MSEKAAWLYLAKRWAKPLKDDKNEYYVHVNDVACYGLCSSIANPAHAGRIDYATSNRMSAVVDKQPRCRTGWCWSWSRRGAAARERFCRQQALRCGRAGKHAKTKST